MAADRKSDENLLNALVDGELSPSEHATAAARLAHDREFARAYATLTRLKATVVECAGTDADIRLPPPRRSRRLVAAGIVAALAAALFLAVLRFMPPDVAPPAADRTAETATPVVFSAEPVIPDLSPAGLHLARTTVNRDAGGQVLVATYLGPRGCRLELWVSHIPSSVAARDATGRRAWRVGSLAYELVAYGMPAARFEKVAEAAERATRGPAAPEAVDQRLVEARVSPAPCVT